MKRILCVAAGIAAALVVSAPAMADNYGLRVGDGGVSIGVQIGTPPPAPMEYIPQARPGFAWTPGYWAWNGYRYVWVQGRWVPVAPPAYVIQPAPPVWGFSYEPERRWEHHEHREHHDRDEHRDRGDWRNRDR
jgi:hypothetical protein